MQTNVFSCVKTEEQYLTKPPDQYNQLSYFATVILLS